MTSSLLLLYKCLARLGVLLAGVLTLQHVLQARGYRTDFNELLVLSLVTIVVVRLWMPWVADNKPN